jgi:hypothetical protein
MPPARASVVTERAVWLDDAPHDAPAIAPWTSVEEVLADMEFTPIVAAIRRPRSADRRELNPHGDYRPHDRRQWIALEET